MFLIGNKGKVRASYILLFQFLESDDPSRVFPSFGKLLHQGVTEKADIPNQCSMSLRRTRTGLRKIKSKSEILGLSRRRISRPGYVLRSVVH